MKQTHHLSKRWVSMLLALVMVLSAFSGILPGTILRAEAASSEIANDSLKITVGDLGQISALNIVNNPTNNRGREVNFVLPNNTNPQNGVQHQWMGEMIFSVRSSEDGTFPADNSGFEEVDTNKTLAAGGSTTASNIAADNPYFSKTVDGSKVTVNYTGLDLDATTARAMKGFDVESSYDMDTADGSLLWTITIKNKSSKYLEFGDVGLPMPWNNKYTDQNSVYNERVTAHTFAGADSGYAYAIRCSGEGNYILFTPVPQSGARIEYVDNWIGSNNGVWDNRTDAAFANWTGDSGGWQPGLSVYYIHSKDIHKTGRSYFEDATSLVLAPDEEQTYQFKFSAIRAGDNTPQDSAASENNASVSIEQRENNLRSILYQNGMIDAVAVPGFQTALNMDTRLDLHYDETQIKDVAVDIQCVHDNDPFDEAHTPEHRAGMVNNDRTGRGLHDGNPAYTESVEFVGAKDVDGETHHIYSLHFGCIGNNSVRVSYKLKVGDEWVDKFTQYEFNTLTELDQAADTHADFMVEQTQDTDVNSATYGIYSDWFFASGRDSSQRSHWGDDWSHDNINFIAMKNYLNPDPDQVRSIETYLIDFMWNNYMKNTQESFTVANYLSASGIYGTSSAPYTRTFSEVMEATGFFNMYRIVKAYPDLIEYREPAAWYLEKAYGIYSNRVGTGAIGFYGEQQIPQMIEALYAEGMTEEGDDLKQQFARYKGRNCVNSTYPYGSEFAYDNTGEEGAFAAAKALAKYYPEDSAVGNVSRAMSMANHKTRAMRGFQPTWYQYADPVFIGGESWWNFQYTASLAGSIMDDWMRYESNDGDSTAWAARVNYAAKLSNFNAINMGQIAATYVGNVSWRYNMYKGGYGAMNVNDGGTRVMNNGWQDFSGESDEGLYGSLLRISADVTTDPIFGLYGYGASVTKTGTSYSITPTDGFGKRVNLLDEKIYVETVQDSIKSAVINGDGSSIELSLKGYTTAAHTSEIDLSGAGLKNGFYTITAGGEKIGQVYVNADKEGKAIVTLTGDATVTLTADANAENEAPKAEIKVSTDELKAIEPFTLTAKATDDGAPEGSSLTYHWEVKSMAGEGSNFWMESPDSPTTKATANPAGEYTIALTVSDGDKSTTVERTLQIGDAPERKAPTIVSATGAPMPGNPTVAALKAEATTDPLYEGVPHYQWEIVRQPEGGNAKLGNAGEAEAKLRVDKGGEYVLKLTVTDEDKSATTEITVTMTDKADGIQRVKTIITQVGTAPTLPTGVVAVRDDGTYSGGAVDWDEVPAEKYAEVGTFEVLGTLRTQTTRVACTVVVVDGERKNIAPFATPTAIINTPSDLGGVAGLNDGYDPNSSTDNSHGVWHNWRGDQGGTAWVMYTWDEPVTIDGADAYYFTDGNFAPKDAKLEYMAEDGQWYEVPNASGLGVALNQYNTTSFSAVTTTKLRMTMSPKTLGVGVIEWKVYGYGNFLDTSALKNAIETAQGINTAYFVDGTKDTLDAAIAEAQAVLNDSKHTQEEINAAAEKLSKVVAGLESKDGDKALTAATVESDYTASWENLNGINNPAFEPTVSAGGTGKGWGNWYQEAGSRHYVGYIWGAPVTVNSADIFWYDDGGGTRIPASMKIEYVDENGAWQTAEIKTALGDCTALDQYNRFDFEKITTTHLRLYVTVHEDGQANGIYRFRLFERSSDEPAASHTIIAMSDYQNSHISSDAKKQVPQAIVDKMLAAGVKSELALLAGDYVDGSVYEDGSDTSQDQMMTELNNLKGILSAGWEDIGYLAIQGNHDWSGFITDGTLNKTGAYEYDDYVVYLINEDDFPWWQAGYASYSDGAACKAAVEKTSQTLDTYLQDMIEDGDTRPVIITTHVPMHWSPRSTTGQSWWNDNIYADTLFDVVNRAGESLDIVFLFGHNHSSYSGTTNGVHYEGYDQDIGGALAYVGKGETMRVPNGTTGTRNYTTETLSFTYMNAGYVGNYNGTQDDCTIGAITITDDAIQIDRYGTDGLRADKSHTIKRGDFQPLLHVESAEGRTDVRRPGETEQFRARLTNAEATGYSWTCDSAIATIANADTAEPTLTYVGDGELTLTCTVTYGDGEQLSATCTLTVETAPVAGEYEQVTDLTKLEEGASYIVVAWRYFGGDNADSTNGYVFQAENNGNVRAATTDGYKTISGTFGNDCFWKLSYTNGKLTMQNVGTGKYLGTSIPAASDMPYELTVASGTVSGYPNFAIGTESASIRYSGSSGTFSFGGGTPASQVTGTNACNLTIYKAASAPTPHEHKLTAVAAKAATCTEAGNIAYWTCECGKLFADAEGKTELTESDIVINALSHDFRDAWSSDDNEHWHECSRCDAVDAKTAHEWDDGVVTKEATETENGVKTFTCTVCGKTRTETIPALGHQHKATFVAGKAANCHETGLKDAWYCEGCGKYFEEEACTTEIDRVLPVNPANHDGATELRNAKVPTYTENGYTGDLFCLGCGQIKQVGTIIPRLATPDVTPIIPGKPAQNPHNPSAGENVKKFPFVDVPSTSWYYDSVREAWENGLIDGVTANAFKPDNQLTVAQAIKLAAALHQMQKTGSVTLTNGSPNWYDSYVAYAVNNGVIEKDYLNYTKAQMNAPATRGEFVHIFNGALVDATAINTVADNKIPDVKTTDKYGAEIYKFYRAGITVGSDAQGTFHPASNIKRSEVAAIVLRMFDTAARKSISLN